MPEAGPGAAGRVSIWRNEPDPPAGPLPLPATARSVVRFVLRAQRATAVAGALMGIGWMVSMAAVPAVLGLVIDRGLDGDGATLAGWLALLGAVGVAQAGFGAGRHWIHNRLNHGTRLITQDIVGSRALDPAGGLERAPAGDLVSRATSDATRLGGLADLCCRGPGAVVSFLLVVVVLLAASPLLGALVLASLVPLTLAMVPLWGPLARRSHEEQQRLAEASAVAADGVVGLRVVKGLGAEEALTVGFGARNDMVRHSAVRVARLSACWDGLAVLAPGVLLVMVAWVGGRLVIEGDLSVGQLVAFFGYAQFLRTPLTRFAELGAKWARALSAAARVAELSNRPGSVTDTAFGEPALLAPVPTVTLVGVRSADGRLDGLTLTMAPGEVLGIVATDALANEALADLLARRADPAAGRIRLDGIALSDLSLDTARAAVLVAEHDPFLFTATLSANIGVHGAFDTDARRAATVAAVDEIAGRLPESWDSVVGERGRTLSGGQRQRVGLARALTAKPPVLVLVEPTSAVDAHTEVAVVSAVLRERAGRTTVLVSTSPAVLAATDRVLFLEDGAVSLTGTHAELLDHAAYRSLVVPEADR